MMMKMPSMTPMMPVRDRVSERLEVEKERRKLTNSDEHEDGNREEPVTGLNEAGL